VAITDNIDKEMNMTTFDFGDNNGPVPAHKHPNGGGWVADTATVDETAFVGPKALVYGHAWVGDNARVCDKSQVYDHACVSGNAKVYDNVRVYENGQVYGNAKLFGNALVYDGDRWEEDETVHK